MPPLSNTDPVLTPPRLPESNDLELAAGIKGEIYSEASPSFQTSFSLASRGKEKKFKHSNIQNELNDIKPKNHTGYLHLLGSWYDHCRDRKYGFGLRKEEILERFHTGRFARKEPLPNVSMADQLSNLIKKFFKQ